MSCRREAPTNDFSVALSPAMKREFFHASKYSDIVGVITTSAVSASCSVGRPLLGGGVEVLGLLVELLDRGEVEARVGQRLAERDLAVAVDVGLGRPLRLGAVERALDEEEEVAGLLVGLAVLGLDRERHRALGIGGVAAGVDDHVVVGERRARRRPRPPSPRRRGWRPMKVFLASPRSFGDLLAGCPRASSSCRSRSARRGRGTAARSPSASPTSPASRCVWSSR